MLNGSLSPTAPALGNSILFTANLWEAADALLAGSVGGEGPASPGEIKPAALKLPGRDLSSMPAVRFCAAPGGAQGSSDAGSPDGLGGSGDGDGGGDDKDVKAPVMGAASEKDDKSSINEGERPMRNNFYDDETFFTSYTTMRKETSSANDFIERPYLEKVLPDLAGKRVLELGCGMGSYVLEFMADAAHVDAVDISEKMLTALTAEVQRRSLENVDVIRSSIEDFDFKQGNYDVVISTLAFHYVADLDAVFKAIARSLKRGGTFVFNVEHPVYTSAHDAGWETADDESYAHWRLDNYFETGMRKMFWHGIEIEKYHRTTEDYFELLVKNGFAVTRLLEPKPSEEARRLDPELDRHHRRPPFLMFSAVKQ